MSKGFDYRYLQYVGKRTEMCFDKEKDKKSDAYIENLARIRQGQAKGRSFGSKSDNIPMTERDIEAAKSPQGGWTKKTFANWGISWPPQKGWKEKLLKHGRPRNAADRKRSH